MTKVEFLKSVFFQVESIQERSNLKVEFEENLNTSWIEAKLIWVDYNWNTQVEICPNWVDQKYVCGLNEEENMKKGETKSNI